MEVSLADRESQWQLPLQMSLAADGEDGFGTPDDRNFDHLAVEHERAHATRFGLAGRFDDPLCKGDFFGTRPEYFVGQGDLAWMNAALAPVSERASHLRLGREAIGVVDVAERAIVGEHTGRAGSGANGEQRGMNAGSVATV